MRRRLIPLLLLLLPLAACAYENTWYEERCLRLGLTKGTADFDACIERDMKWIEENRARANRNGGP